MKKMMIAIGCALMFGIGFGFYFFKDLDKGIKQVLGTEDIAYAFQVGVYTDKENAVIRAAEFSSGTVIEDEELYRVYIAIVKQEELVDKLKAYYDAEDVEYYVKRISINGEFMAELSKYEELLLASSSNVYPHINKEVLKNYSDVIV